MNRNENRHPCLVPDFGRGETTFNHSQLNRYRCVLFYCVLQIPFVSLKRACFGFFVCFSYLQFAEMFYYLGFFFQMFVCVCVCSEMITQLSFFFVNMRIYFFDFQMLSQCYTSVITRKSLFYSELYRDIELIKYTWFHVYTDLFIHLYRSFYLLRKIKRF